MLPPNLARLTELFSAYQEQARAVDLAADRLSTQIIKMERQQGFGPVAYPGIPSYRAPAVVQAREAYRRAALHEEQAYFAWLWEVTCFLGREWLERIEIMEMDGWYVVIERDGESYMPCVHRDGELVRYHSRHEAVLWLHHRAVAARKGEQGAA